MSSMPGAADGCSLRLAWLHASPTWLDAHSSCCCGCAHQVIVIDRARAQAASADILRQNGITGACSDGLRDEPLMLPSDLQNTHQPNMTDSEVLSPESAEAVGTDDAPAPSTPPPAQSAAKL